MAEENVQEIKETTPGDDEQQKALEKNEKKLKRSDRSIKSYQFFLIRLAAFLLIVWVLFFFIIGLIRMPNGDMYPRIDAGDLVMFYRLDKDVRAQDIIVIEKNIPEIEGKQRLVCRVVAVQGDRVEISEDDRLIVNGNTIVESNIFYPTPRYEGPVEYPLVLGEGECFVLADSRNGGMDSRYCGPVNKSEIQGTVITIMRHNNL